MALHVVTCGELLWKPIDVYNLKTLRSTSEVNQTWLEDGAFGVIPKRQIERGIEGRCDCIFATVGLWRCTCFITWELDKLTDD